MAKKEAPVTLTGGAGFNYEDYVASRFLVDMLAGLHPFGPNFGTVVKIDWQVRDTGRLLDDLMISLNAADGQHVAELSVKSHRQITEAGFPGDFVEACWEEWLHDKSSVFQNDRDLLIFATGSIAITVIEAWHKTLRESLCTSPERMLARLTPPSRGHSTIIFATEKTVS